jgi:DNA-3-methyladenine glycosylase II
MDEDYPRNMTLDVMFKAQAVRMTMTQKILGRYDMAAQNQYFGGWAQAADGGIVMAFPVEGWQESAAVTIRPDGPDSVTGTVHGGSARAWDQAMSVLSLDYDGSGYAEVGERDPIIGALQREHGFVRPVLFHSPYEAACAFIIAHRMRIEQGRAIRARMARDHGAAFDVAGTVVHAFPTPERLLELTTIPGVADEKVARLHGVAEAALAGRLDRARLREMPLDEALADVRMLRGIGEFFAVAIVMRGAGLIDAVPRDAMTNAGIERLYGTTDVDRISDGWRPYRMWCSVLVHMSERRSR